MRATRTGADGLEAAVFPGLSVIAADDLADAAQKVVEAAEGRA